MGTRLQRVDGLRRLKGRLVLPSPGLEDRTDEKVDVLFNKTLFAQRWHAHGYRVLAPSDDLGRSSCGRIRRETKTQIG